MKDPNVVAAIVPAAGTVIGALWYSLADASNPQKAKAQELARGLYWVSILWLVYVLSHVTVGL